MTREENLGEMVQKKARIPAEFHRIGIGTRKQVILVAGLPACG